MPKLSKLCISFVIFVILLAGCGTDSSLKTITVSPAISTIGINKSQRFYATAYDSQGNILTKTISWSVEGSIGTIDVSSGVFYAGTSTGTGYVKATADSITGASTVTITDKGSITGTIKNQEGNAVSNLTVFLTLLPSFSASTSSTGSYTISNIEYGTYEVKTLENIQYLSSTLEAYVATAETTTKNITLDHRLTIGNESLSGDPITVSGIVYNHGTTEAKSATVSYLFYDEEGTLASSGSTPLGNISVSSSEVFYLVPSPPISTYTSVTKTALATSY